MSPFFPGCFLCSFKRWNSFCKAFHTVLSFCPSCSRTNCWNMAGEAKKTLPFTICILALLEFSSNLLVAKESRIQEIKLFAVILPTSKLLSLLFWGMSSSLYRLWCADSKLSSFSFAILCDVVSICISCACGVAWEFCTSCPIDSRSKVNA